MPRKIGDSTREDLVNAPLPDKTKTYTVISHSYAINTILQTLEDCGFEVEAEDYRCNEGAKVAHGSFIINYQGDPELKMTYSFSNSYDKSLRFKSAIGAQVTLNGAYMLCDMNHWIRKHTGTADNETETLIKEHITNAKQYFDQLVSDKEKMKEINISITEFGSIIGELFLRKILTVDQISAIGKEYDSPSYQYSTGKLNLWTCYNHIILALKQSHPSKWMHNQISVHLYFSTRYNFEQFDDPAEPAEVEGEVTEQVNIDGEEVPAMKSILDQVPPVILPGFDNPVVEAVIPQEHLEPMEEYKNPNQITLDDAIEAEAKKEQEPVNVAPEINPEYIKEHCELCDKTYDPNDTTCVKCMAPEEEPVVIKEEVVQEQPVPGEAVPGEAVPAVTTDVYLPKSEFPGIEVEDDFELEGKFLHVKYIEVVEGVDYLVCAPAELTPFEEEVLQNENPEAVTLEVEETPVDETPVEQSISSDPGVEEIPLPEVEATAPEEIQEVPETPNDLAAATVTADPRVYDILQAELEAIYGHKPEFTYIKTESQYEITLSTGETCTLTKTYIDGLL